jgi:glycogen debranching enzyme
MSNTFAQNSGPASAQYSKPMKILMHFAVCAALFLSFANFRAWPQTHTATASESGLTLSTESVGPVRFVAVHGRRSAIFGYPDRGLEIWAWPFQILNGYHIGIRSHGAATEINGDLLLRRIDYAPDAVTRIYIGPDFVVREKLFVPLDLPGAIITYEVEGRGHVDISVHFTPVLNLMWPASVGGQSTAWNDAVSGYVISDGAASYTATIRSPDAISHDSTENSAIHYSDALAFTIRPNASAHVFVGLNQTRDPAVLVKQLAAEETALERQAATHYVDLVKNTLQIETPDEEVNRALAWSEIALDQARVCNPDLGCGLVAGYGPSRNARRPQYAWFFAGDGLIAMDGLVASGEYDRARDELDFILKYQDRKTGMIWHELSQSAGHIDWAGKYPYMFVHVDITFQFLSTLFRYVEASGDTDFAKQNWPAIESAYRYCQSIIDPATSLPRIPPDKEGGNEQDRESDELSLSAAWLETSSAFAKLAEWTAHPQDAAKAIQAIAPARASIATRYWDNGRQFWISGHTVGGKEIFDERSQPSGLIAEQVFSQQQNETLLDKIASSNFQADWGSRGLSSSSAAFDPDSYAKGSVFALSTAGIAETFWVEHRPVAALPIWTSIVPWTRLDALGHIHEVLAGDSYRQQTESVPEQTWSSAGFISAAVSGLLGLHVDSVSNQIAFSPHLPTEWREITIRNVRMQHAAFDLHMQRSDGSIDLTVTNRARPASFVFDPQIPLGARLLGAQCGSHRLVASIEHNAQDEHARLAFSAAQGTAHCSIRFQGGVEVIPPQVAPHPGDRSTGIKITSVELRDHSLIIEADVNAARTSFDIETAWRSASVDGGTIHQIAGNLYRVDFDPDERAPDSFGYTHRRAVVHFENTH